LVLTSREAPPELATLGSGQAVWALELGGLGVAEAQALLSEKHLSGDEVVVGATGRQVRRQWVGPQTGGRDHLPGVWRRHRKFHQPRASWPWHDARRHSAPARDTGRAAS